MHCHPQRFSSIMLTEPLIRFFKFNLMLNKQNCDNMSEMKKKKTWIIIPKKNKAEETLLIKLY